MKTFILFWNPAISSYTLERLTNDITCNELNDDFDWSIRDHQLAHKGDRFFMVRCKNKPVPGKLNQWGKQLWEPFVDDHTGICMSGKFISEPYREKDWSGKGREVFYMKMFIDVAVNPDEMPVLKSSELLETIPDYNWKGGASGRLIDEYKAEKLTNMWMEFCKNHKEEFSESVEDAFIDDEFRRKI